MGTKTKLVDGKQALDAQENALNFMENSLFAQTISYTKAPNEIAGTFPNQAVLNDVPIGQQPKPIKLQAVDVGSDATPVINQQQQAGKTLVFQGVAFVSSKEKTVLAFR